MTHSNSSVEALSPGGILMIIIAAIGLFSAFTMIVCLLALSRRRIRAETQIETLNRALTPSHFRSFPPAFDCIPTQIQVRSLFGPCPSTDPKFEFRPPSYEEVMRASTSVMAVQPSASNTLDLPASDANRRSRSPPPAFAEVDPLSWMGMSSTPCSERYASRSSPSSTSIAALQIENPSNQVKNNKIVTISSRYDTLPTSLVGSSSSSPTQPNSTL